MQIHDNNKGQVAETWIYVLARFIHVHDALLTKRKVKMVGYWLLTKKERGLYPTRLVTKGLYGFNLQLKLQRQQKAILREQKFFTAGQPASIRFVFRDLDTMSSNDNR